MGERSAVLVEGKVWLRQIYLANEGRILSLWLAVNREAAAGNARRARETAREMLRELCVGLPRWLPAFRVRRLLPKAIELAGLGRKDGGADPSGEEQLSKVSSALSDFEQSVFYLSSRLGVTERELLEGTRPASLNKLFWATQREEARKSLDRCRDQHYEPEARIESLEATIRRLDEKIRCGSTPTKPRKRNEKRWTYHEASVRKARPWAKNRRGSSAA